MKNILRIALLLSVCLALCSCELAYKAPEKGKVHILVGGAWIGSGTLLGTSCFKPPRYFPHRWDSLDECI